MAIFKTQQARIAALGLFATIAAFFLFRSSGRPAPQDPLDAVPKESFLVATIDVAELRRTPVYDVLLGKGGGTKALSLSGLEDACGFDPFSRIDRLAVAVPEKEGERDFGIVAKVAVSRDELATCKRRLDEKKGDAPPPATRERGSFAIIDGVRAQGVSGSLAYGRGDLLVVSRGDWFEQILATANGERPSIRSSEQHAELRAALTAREGWRMPTIVLTAVLPRALRDRIRAEMGVDAVMAGVLGVSGVGAAVRAGPSGGTIDARVHLKCDSADACASVEKLIQKKRLAWSKDLALRMIGFGGLIDSLETRRDGADLEVAASANADALAATITRVLKMRRPLPPALPPPGQAPPADETLRAGDGG